MSEITSTTPEKQSFNEFQLRTITPEDTELWHQYGMLRAKVYIDERGFMDESDRNENGEEFDEDDERSTAIIAENDGVIYGCVRLIERGKDKLPIEEYFDLPEGMVDRRSIEISRLIVDKKKLDSKSQNLAVMSLLRAIHHHGLAYGIDEMYSTLETPLKRRLETIGIGVEVIGESKQIDHYHTKNYPALIRPSTVIDSIDTADETRLESGSGPEARFAPFFRQAKLRRGLGAVSIKDFLPNPKQFERNFGFFSKEEQEVLLKSRVAIAGTGGDGGQIALTLAQMGIGEFSLADPESFEVENLNRQAGSNYDTIERNKAEVIREEILKINPWARVMVFKDGVNRENLDKFMEGANILIDETEYTKPEIGVMLARKAREQGIANVMGLNVGFGGRTIAFHPQGKTFESFLGVSEEESLENVSSAEVPLNNWIGRLPSYANMEVFKKVASGEISAPSVAPGVLIAAGVTASQAASILLSDVTPAREKHVVWADKMIYTDALDRQEVVSKSKLRFALSAIKALYHTRRGDNPPYNF